MRIALATLNDLEKRFDGKLASIGTVNDPLDLLGTTRGSIWTASASSSPRS